MEWRYLTTLTALPADPYFVATEEALESSLALLKALIPTSAHSAERFDEPRFFGSELFSSQAQCPVCGTSVERSTALSPDSAGRRWFAQVDTLGANRAPAATLLAMPGCGHQVPVSAIQFEFPTGAARCAITAHFETWWGEWYGDDASAPAEPLAALSQSFGTPLRFVRAYLGAPPDLRRAIEQLTSADDEVRLAGASLLDQVSHDNDILDFFVEDHADALLAAWHATAHSAVRGAILHLLGGARYGGQAVRDIVAATLRTPDQSLSAALFVCHWGPIETIRPLVPLIRQCHTHDDPDIRQRCVFLLVHLQARDPEDRAAIRTLAVDRHLGVRGTAVNAMESWIKDAGTPLDDADRLVLEQVSRLMPLNCPIGNQARKLLA